jgi:hypothetical protein
MIAIAVLGLILAFHTSLIISELLTKNINILFYIVKNEKITLNKIQTT